MDPAQALCGNVRCLHPKVAHSGLNNRACDAWVGGGHDPCLCTGWVE